MLEQTLSKLKYTQERINALTTEMDGLKEEVLLIMKGKGLNSIDAKEKLGLTITRTARRNYHYDLDKLLPLVANRQNEIMTVDKKKVDELAKELPAINQALVEDGITEFIKVNLVKNAN